jgi:hypothetical protein
MAVKKSSKKAGAKKAGPKSKTGAKRAAPAKKAAAKRKPAAGAGAKKASPKRKTGAKPATPTKKAATTSKAAAEAAVEKGSPAPKPAKKTTKGKFSSMSVNIGHVFSLRPRVNTSFRQADFLTARLLLQDEAYQSIEEAARAVVEKALDMTHEGPSKRGFKPGR